MSAMISWCDWSLVWSSRLSLASLAPSPPCTLPSSARSCCTSSHSRDTSSCSLVPLFNFC